MLPSRGRCLAVFLLVYSARLNPRLGLAEWIVAAREKSTIMAHALDLEGTAKGLVALNLARSEPAVAPAAQLIHLNDQADFPTLVGIARVLLERAPPSWIRVAVNGSRVAREYIPASDLAALAWLGDEFDAVLIEAHQRAVAPSEEDVRKRLGDAAELIVLAALRRAGRRPVHVALISNAYGYDIELRAADRTDRLEVKAAVRRTCGVVHVSRNEFDKSRLFGTEWRLVQVVFSTGALVRGPIGPAHVEEIRELPGAALRALAPLEPNGFRWSESAEFRPPSEAWMRSGIVPDPAFWALSER
ncbi:hypothetical protein TSH58_25700 [Azospirillum sp. TSH58]|nr:hypothetical protein TSH58_25700 [Azospirillum sp. TSH58]